MNLTPVQALPAWFGYSVGAANSTVDVSGDRVFFNTADVRGNVWATSRR